MLVLSRKFGEKVFIGPDIVVTVLDVAGGKVRLGIDAPRDVVVTREELGRPRPVEPPPRPGVEG